MSFLCITRANARWASPDDAETEIEFENSEIFVKLDGTFSETIETKIKILKDSARESSATKRFVYNSMISEFKIVEAKTIVDDHDYPVESKLIEDKPLASSPSGFDQHNQVLVAFPQMQVNSEIYFKYVSKTKEAPIPGFFSTSMVYGTEALEKSGVVIIHSEMPLFVAVNDPEHVVQVKQESLPKNSPFPFLTQVRLLKPVLKIPMDESSVHLDPMKLPWVDVSSEKQWSEMAKPLLAQYEKVLNEPLPGEFKKILEAAKKESNPIDQMNVVTSRLAAFVNYLGDWRPVAGLYVPRGLRVVASTKFGDCKDFASVTTAILRQLGMKANVAWVKRGLGAAESPNRLPSMGEFNHAIVHVQIKGKPIWVDPTNFASFAQGVFPDIADRKALVLDTAGPSLQRIPPISADDSQVILSKDVHIQDRGDFQVGGSLHLKGSSALSYAGASLRASQQSIDYSIVKAIGDENLLLNWKVEPTELSSRIVRDIPFRFHFAEKNSDLKTTAGSAILLSSGSHIPIFLTQTAGRVSDLFLGTPVTVRREVQFNHIVRLGAKSLNCNIDSEWFSATRQVLDDAEGVKVIDSVVLKKSLIPNSELSTPAYSKLQDYLQGCFNGVAIIYSRNAKDSSSTGKPRL